MFYGSVQLARALPSSLLPSLSSPNITVRKSGNGRVVRGGAVVILREGETH